MRVLSFSETGCVRKNNEDAYLVSSAYGLYAVADGMGGHQAGEVASRTALSRLEQLAPAIAGLQDEELEEWLNGALSQANKAVYEFSLFQAETVGMGTTVTALLIRGSKAVLAHVGDSRGYLWRGEQLIPLTNDHSYVEELLRMGHISSDEAENHPKRHLLTRAVGMAEDVEVDSRTVEVQPGDVLILCTDGFSNMLSMEELMSEFRKTVSWEEHWAALRQLVLTRGAPDNFTALCCILG